MVGSQKGPARALLRKFRVILNCECSTYRAREAFRAAEVHAEGLSNPSFVVNQNSATRSGTRDRVVNCPLGQPPENYAQWDVMVCETSVTKEIVFMGAQKSQRRLGASFAKSGASVPVFSEVHG